MKRKATCQLPRKRRHFTQILEKRSNATKLPSIREQYTSVLKADTTTGGLTVAIVATNSYEQLKNRCFPTVRTANPRPVRLPNSWNSYERLKPHLRGHVRVIARVYIPVCAHAYGRNVVSTVRNCSSSPKSLTGRGFDVRTVGSQLFENFSQLFGSLTGRGFAGSAQYTPK